MASMQRRMWRLGDAHTESNSLKCSQYLPLSKSPPGLGRSALLLLGPIAAALAAGSFLEAVSPLGRLKLRWHLQSQPVNLKESYLH